ncbi:MAG: Diphthine synthase [Candidatus Methanosuratincola subterraneus]|uniref:Diphthine synthase n=1 Tax=Methanosuratincola subterraneus TaxID=2593994 RepID=A0A3S3S7F4_METS7|nr:MAG: Diphthine synthase [Candidatus Methanosuratincola subterraneus]
MPSLAFIGLGLYDEKGISLHGLEIAKSAEIVLLESYTNIMPGLNLESLGKMIGKEIRLIGRREVEDGKWILDAAAKREVALLVAGDPFVATTHVDLRLRAIKRGIRVEVVNAPSIVSVAPGAVGLQNYKFGKSATITFPEPLSLVPYETLRINRSLGLHSLFFLDLRVEEGRFMKAGEAIRLLLDMEAKQRGGVVSEEMLMVVLARAGSPSQLVRAGKAAVLEDLDFGPPPHSLIVPGRLHFMEAEALVLIGGADEDLVRGYL